MIKISLLAAIAVVLMYFDFPIIPAFPWLKIDLSEVPALMGGFAYGPVAGGVIVVLKVFLRFLIKGTETGFSLKLLRRLLVRPATLKQLKQFMRISQLLWKNTRKNRNQLPLAKWKLRRFLNTAVYPMNVSKNLKKPSPMRQERKPISWPPTCLTAAPLRLKPLMW